MLCSNNVPYPDFTKLGLHLFMLINVTVSSKNRILFRIQIEFNLQ